MKLLIKLLITFLSFSVFIVSSVSAKIDLPDMPTNYVVDLAGIINDNIESKLNKYFKELEQKTTAQLAILTIKNLEGESIEELSIRVAHDKWKLGQKGRDNGVLILVSLRDRKYRIEIGYGFEKILPDNLLGAIGRQILIPYCKEGDYSTGLFETSLAVISVIADDAGVKITGMPKPKIDPYHLIQKIVKEKFDEFTRKNGVEYWPPLAELSVNPFIYKGKNVGIVLTFNTMITATQGVFKSDGKFFVVSNIPKGLFKSKERVVLAGRVLGKTEIKMGFSLFVPHLKYVGSHFCEDWKCNDIIPQ